MSEHPRELIVRIHTDEGVTGLGETNAKPSAVEEMIHSVCSELLLGENPLNIEKIWSTFYRMFNHHGYAGTELRALSAIDIALWDILGKVSKQPLYRLLGGASREQIKVYNTSVGYMENNDRDRFIEEPEKLAEELLEQGISVMKIWPFDELSVESQGNYISPSLLKKGIEPFKKIRQEFGTEMELILEGHGRWNLTSATRIAKELEEYELLWLEDLMPVHNLDTISQLKQSTQLPIGASERLFTRYQYHQLLEKNGADVVIADPAWTGGITETKKIADLAEIYGLPFAPHNCGGPILHTTIAHLCFNIPNLLMMETVRAFYDTYFEDVVNGIPTVANGSIVPPERPGLGIELNEDIFTRTDLTQRISENESRNGEMKVYNLSGKGDPWKT
ncbi:mandelate racemase/muconate lactonizing enzyme family protein [Salsuginibacillus kocurii]|uniref:mandelate racemase/muconate lactonizing enzyme family protein n=1 Tax=Salsuginibacillus kocurii TaxID=427078 RepID=UPI00037F5B65|nr:mandelate racemase/muconate lactonizing enzyme family protein [Salsuginibacillus kocurii]